MRRSNVKMMIAAALTSSLAHHKSKGIFKSEQGGSWTREPCLNRVSQWVSPVDRWARAAHSDPSSPWPSPCPTETWNSDIKSCGVNVMILPNIFCKNLSSVYWNHPEKGPKPKSSTNSHPSRLSWRANVAQSWSDKEMNWKKRISYSRAQHSGQA
jgi:hypothetical protein